MGKTLTVLAAVLLLTLVLAGCASGTPGIAPEEYNKVAVQLKDAQSQVAQSQNDAKSAQSKVTELTSEIARLKDASALVGKTPRETAERIVKRYHETHLYEKYDIYVCSDMAMDIWDMLKAQGISSVVQVGRVDRPVGEITDSDHAWLLAEVAKGEYLALEATGGYSVSKAEKPLYYQGWSFSTPKDYKKFEELYREMNVRASILNQTVAKSETVNVQYKQDFAAYQALVDEYNRKFQGRPVSAESQALSSKIEAQVAVFKEKEGRYKQLQELTKEMKQVIDNQLVEAKKAAGPKM